MADREQDAWIGSLRDSGKLSKIVRGVDVVHTACCITQPQDKPLKPTRPVEPNLRTGKRNSAGGSQDFTRDPQHQRRAIGDNMPAQRSRLGNPALAPTPAKPGQMEKFVWEKTLRPTTQRNHNRAGSFDDAQAYRRASISANTVVVPKPITLYVMLCKCSLADINTHRTPADMVPVLEPVPQVLASEATSVTRPTKGFLAKMMGPSAPRATVHVEVKAAGTPKQSTGTPTSQRGTPKMATQSATSTPKAATAVPSATSIPKSQQVAVDSGTPAIDFSTAAIDSSTAAVDSSTPATPTSQPVTQPADMQSAVSSPKSPGMANPTADSAASTPKTQRVEHSAPHSGASTPMSQRVRTIRRALSRFSSKGATPVGTPLAPTSPLADADACDSAAVDPLPEEPLPEEPLVEPSTPMGDSFEVEEPCTPMEEAGKECFEDAVETNVQDEVVVPNPNDFVVPDDAQNVVEEEEPMMSKEEAVVVEEQPSMVPTGEPIKRTPTGMRLAAQAEIVSQMTVRQALEQLGAGTMVHKAWVRDGRGKGSTRQVRARVLNDLVLLTYQSGMVKRSTSIVIVRCCLTIEQNKTTLQLETDHGALSLQPLTPQHETLWALGLNSLLHVAEKQGELDQATILEDLPWHGIVQGERA